MPSSSTEIVFDSSDKGIANTFEKMNRNQDRLYQKLDRLEKKSDRGAKASASNWMKVGETFKNVGLALVGGGGILSGLDLIKSANREIIEQAAEIAERYEDAAKRFRVQSGLRGIEAGDAQRRIEKIAVENAVSLDTGFAAATQLVSSGFTAREASGGSLDAFLDVLAATNQTGEGVDSEGLAKAMAGFLTANQLELTGENIRTYGGGLQSLFKSTNLQLDALPSLGKEAGALQSALSPQEQLAAAAVLQTQGSQDASSSATNLRNVVGRLQTAAASDTAGPALERLGLTAADVDFVGERIDDVLGRIGAGLQSVPEEERAGIAKSLVSEAGIASLNTLIANRSALRKNVADQANLGQFDADVAEAQQGAGAARIRLETASEVRRTQQYQADDIIKASLREELESRGYAQARTELFLGAYSTARAFGAGPDTAADLGMGDYGEFAEVQDAALKRATQAAGLESNPQSFEEFAEALRENTRSNRDVAAEMKKRPPAPPRSAGLGAGG
ncbi:phage tail tape measure protein [Alienimonas sp. DA493]|uniref:phage tail tape measure protein n=1 Tax=Alienimonas sp. DA493 TaxID=3373605 RepID=UPI003755001B